MSLITVWRIPLNASNDVLAQLQLLLSDEERYKAGKFKHDVHRRRYLVRHAAMRQILARETQCAPNELRFATATLGKPSLANPFESVQFNLTHSADMALLAVTRHDAVGVDIEEQRPLADIGALTTQVCSSTEVRLVTNATDDEQMFYRCWVGKEAVLKCLGCGLNLPMTDFDVLDMQGNLMTSPALPRAWFSAGTVVLHLLDILSERFLGAVAVLKNATDIANKIEVQLQDWTP